MSPSPSGGLLFFESEDEAAFFEERAAIREYGGAGVSRVAAERLAMMDVLNARRLVAGARNQVEREAG